MLTSFSKIEDCREVTFNFGDWLRENATIVILKGPLHHCLDEAKQSHHSPILPTAIPLSSVRSFIVLSEATGISD